MALTQCVRCLHQVETNALDPSCERCGSSVLLVGRESTRVSSAQFESLPPGVWRYRAFLPEVAEEDIVTLGEGGTPLLHAERLGREIGVRNLMIKDESRNPTGSFMDRGSTVLLSLAKKRGVKSCSCVTTGNLGASLSAYCAKANIKASITVHQDTDQGKLYQMLAYGAELGPSSPRPSRSGEEDTLEVTAGNPYILEGEKTTGFELIQDLGWKTPDVVMVPVGTGGHLLMIWRSILQLREAGLLDGGRCRLLAVQAEGGSSRVGYLIRRGESRRLSAPLAELENSVPFFRKEAAKAVSDSGGSTLTATYGDTIAATGLLARSEGIFAEPSSASVIAALSSAVNAGTVGRDESVVCIITGAGLKDPKAVVRLAREARRVTLREPSARPSSQIGETKFALLRLLQGRPNYGYELRRLLGPERQISTASVYQHLLELEDFGMVRRRGSVILKGRERINYELTKRGNDYLRIAGKLERAERAQ
jgi:threonine synthase